MGHDSFVDGIGRGRDDHVVVDDEFDSPFAHVPSSDAGPNPLQEGPFTYGKLVESTPQGPYSRKWRVAAIVFFAIVAIGMLAGLIEALTGN